MAVWRRIQYPAKVEPFSAAIDPIEELGWRPSIPSLPTLRVGLSAALIATSIAIVPLAVTEPVEAEELGWAPVYEANPVIEPEDRQSHPSVFSDPDPVAAVFDPETFLSPVAPVRIHVPPALRHVAPSVFFDSEPIIFEPAQLPWVFAPDRLDRLQTHPSQAPFYSDPGLPPAVPDLSWAPRVPDQVAPTQGLHAALQRATFFDPEPIPADEEVDDELPVVTTGGGGGVTGFLLPTRPEVRRAVHRARGRTRGFLGELDGRARIVPVSTASGGVSGMVGMLEAEAVCRPIIRLAGGVTAHEGQWEIEAEVDTYDRYAAARLEDAALIATYMRRKGRFS